jgi:predicted mannosyl-3-phosphoglycerate phosphatase (HAD superfamily)
MEPMKTERELAAIPPTGAVESVVIALHKVIDLLDRIKGAIEESSSKIPKAAVQLNTVTQATEMATVEILNVLDTMSHKLATVEEAVGRMAYGSMNGQAALVTTVQENLAEVRQDTMNITMALQVQDITAQKIAAANHLIESVRVELMHELSYFEGSGLHDRPLVPDLDLPQEAPGHTFDKNASYLKSTEQQERIDNVVRQWREQRGESQPRS